MWRELIHSDLIVKSTNLISDAKNASNNSVNSRVSSEILENIVLIIRTIDKIPKIPRERAFPKVIRNRLHRAYMDLLLKGNANLE